MSLLHFAVLLVILGCGQLGYANTLANEQSVVQCRQVSDQYVQCGNVAFKATLNSPMKSAELVEFVLTKDVGLGKGYSRRYRLLDDALLRDCQAKSADPFGKGYHVGHMAAIDHFDFDDDLALSTNAMINMHPQNAYLNAHGAWRITEKLTECYRDIHPELNILAGPIWDGANSNQWFVETHGVITPDSFWKLIRYGNRYDAWIIPNAEDRQYGNLEDERVTLNELLVRLLSDKDRHSFALAKLAELNESNLKSAPLDYDKKCRKRGVDG